MLFRKGEEMKRVLITGSGSYIGTSVERWLNRPQFAGLFRTETTDLRGDRWRKEDFSNFDAVFHVAGIAHADIGRISEEQRQRYYEINCDLAVETAKKAKSSGVRQFIYMSSIIVYGEETSTRKKCVITRETVPSPQNFYGDSKWRAEKMLSSLAEDGFRVAILRPPMIYGKGSKGNYPILSKLAVQLPVFPDMKNERSMLFIDNLCEFVRLLILCGEGGVFFPQNEAYVNTAEMVSMIAHAHRRRIRLTKALNWGVALAEFWPGKWGGMVNKAFGNLVYDRTMSGLGDRDISAYQMADLWNSVLRTEGKE